MTEPTASASSLLHPTQTVPLGHRELPAGNKRSVLLGALGLAALAIPVGAYLWFVDHFSVNVVYQDEWSDVFLIHSWKTSGLTFGDLWASHGDHRLLFPNIIDLGLTQFTHLNVVFEEYLSAVMLVATTALFIVTHRRRSPLTPLIWYLPLALLLFSFVQYQNTLWGFQMAWYLVTLAVAAVLYFLDRPLLTQAAFVAAVAAAVVASYSSLQGLIVWPVGLLLLYFRRRSKQQLIAWCTLALLTAVLYFYHLNPSEYSDQTYVFTHPIASLKFLLFLLGSILGVQLTNHSGAEIAFGGVLLAVSIGLVVCYWRQDEQTARPFGVALVVYGVLFGASITQGRAWFDLWAPSRYSICGLLTLAGCYLVLIDRSGATDRSTTTAAKIDVAAVLSDGPWLRWRRRGLKAASILVAVSIVLEVILGTGHGFASAKTWSKDQKLVADVTVNYQKASSTLLGAELFKGNPEELRTLPAFMAAQHLSVFGTSDRSHFAHIGLPPALTAVQTRIVLPRKGTKLAGTHVLDASTIDPSGVSSVRFVATNSSGHHSLIGVGKPSRYGWITLWNTRTVPNGLYDLVSVATGYGAKVAQSTPIRINVHN